MTSLDAELTMLARRECSTIELVDAAIDRIERRDPLYNAVIHPRFDRARADVAAAAGRPFRGVPIVVKDATCPMAGEPLHEGLQVAKDAGYRAPANSWLTNRLLAAGFVILGRTNVPELCTHTTTEPLAYGPTRNPWDRLRSAGGSSGGSGAAVAAGMVSVAHGTDGGGSVRAPAAWCGLVGLKPTRGRISNGPDDGEHWAGLSTDGFLTRTARDSALMLDAMCGSAIGDPYSTPLTGSLVAALARPLARLRIGLRVHGVGDADAPHPDVARSIRRLADLFADHGHDVTEAWPDAIDDPAAVAQQGTVVSACVAAELDRWSVRLGRPIGLDEIEPRNRVSVGAGRLVSAPQWVTAREWLHQWGRRLHAWWNDFDVLLTPTITQPAIPIGALPVAPSASDMARMRRQLGWLVGMWNVSGQPTISVPAQPTDDGLPVGAQFVAAWGREDLLLQLARFVEQA